METAALIEDLLDRGVLADGKQVSKQPGCCVAGCEVPPLPSVAE